MSSENLGVAVLSLVILLIGVAIGVLVGNSSGRHAFRTEAVKAGHARFVTDENGGVKFEWKEVK